MTLNEYKGNYFINFISKYYSYILLLLILLGYCTAFLIGRLDPPILITSLMIVLPILVAALILHINRFERPISFLNYRDAIIDIPGISLKILFTIIYLITIIILASFPTRPTVYFVLITILYLLIFFQILCDFSKPSIILIQIILLLLNFCYGITLKYPYYYGMTDYIGHIFMSDFIVKTSHTIPETLEMTYAHFPLYHITMAIGSIFTGLSVQVTTFLISNFVFSITVLFAYLLAHLITKNQRLSLLSAYLYASFYVVVFYSHYMVTRSMAYVGFIVILYLLFKMIQENRASGTLKVLLLIMSLFVLTVHQVSLPQFIILLIVLIICILLTINKLTNLNFLISLISLFFAYWIYVSWDFFYLLIKSRTNTQYYDTIILNSDKPVLIGTSWIFDSIDYIFVNIHSSIFLFFAIIGIGVILSRKKNPYLIICALFCLITMIFFIPTPLNNLYVIQWLFRADRFGLMVSPIMAIIMGVGIFYFLSIYPHMSAKKFVVLIISILLCISVYSSLTITYNAGDSSDLHPTFANTYFKSDELSTFSYLVDHSDNYALILSDSLVRKYFNPFKYFTEADQYGYKYFQLPNVPPIDRLSCQKGIFIYRKDNFLVKERLSFYDFTYTYSPENLHLIESQLNEGQKIYSVKTNEIYQL